MVLRGSSYLVWVLLEGDALVMGRVMVLSALVTLVEAALQEGLDVNISDCFV
jgi:hypothetical protein